MLPEDDRMNETCSSVFKCFNVNFRLLKTVYVRLLVCYLNYKMHGATIKKTYSICMGLIFPTRATCLLFHPSSMNRPNEVR